MVKVLQGTPVAYRSRGAHVLVHAVRPTRPWYSGMTEKALCGARVGVSDTEFDAASAISCKRCVAKTRKGG